MDVFEAIFTRRSIRRYTAEGVSEEVVEKLLKAAMVAPSAADERPWHFVVITEKDVLTALSQGMEHCEMLEEATLAVLICGDESLEKIKGFWVQDCSACAENILLAAHGAGIGAVWVAVYPLPERIDLVRRVLKIPEQVTPFAVIAAGHPAEHLPPEDRYDPSRVHYQRW